jgi:hypothetical protein
LIALEQFQSLDKAWAHFKNIQSSYYQLGPFTVCINFVNERLASKLTQAFNHLKIGPVCDPDLSICLWDSSVAERKLPVLDWNLINRNGYQGYYDQHIYLHYFEHINALSMLNTDQNKAYYAVRDIESLPWWVSGSPLQVILHAWLRHHGMHLTHTAAVGNDQAAVLLSGKGGSGKSTTTLACLTEGLHYLGEDYCILEPGKQPRVHSVYQTAKWEPQTRRLFPHYEHCIMNADTADTEKALVYYQDIFPSQIKTSLPIRAVISLKVGTETAPQVQKYEPRLALKDLMMSTLMQLPLYHSDSMSILKDIVASVPQYHLSLGRDVKANVKIIKKILSGQEQ